MPNSDPEAKDQREKWLFNLGARAGKLPPALRAEFERFYLGITGGWSLSETLSLTGNEVKELTQKDLQRIEAKLDGMSDSVSAAPSTPGPGGPSPGELPTATGWSSMGAEFDDAGDPDAE